MPRGGGKEGKREGKGGKEEEKKRKRKRKGKRKEKESSYENMTKQKKESLQKQCCDHVQAVPHDDD